VRKKVHPKKKVEINFKKSVTKKYSVGDQKKKKTKKSLYHMTKNILQMIKKEEKNNQTNFCLITKSSFTRN
jgi:hypothetical protein